MCEATIVWLGVGNNGEGAISGANRVKWRWACLGTGFVHTGHYDKEYAAEGAAVFDNTLPLVDHE